MPHCRFNSIVESHDLLGLLRKIIGQVVTIDNYLQQEVTLPKFLPVTYHKVTPLFIMHVLCLITTLRSQ